jgi:hypothetical protein
VATTAVLSLLPEIPRYPNLGAYPKYGDFTLYTLLYWGLCTCSDLKASCMIALDSGRSAETVLWSNVSWVCVRIGITRRIGMMFIVWSAAVQMFSLFQCVRLFLVMLCRLKRVTYSNRQNGPILLAVW